MAVTSLMRKAVRLFAAFVMVIAASVPSFAAQKTLGVIFTGDIPFYRQIHRSFSDALAAKGIKVEVLLQTPSPTNVAWMNSVRKLVSIDVDIIVTYGASVTAAAISQTSKIPVLFAGVFDPKTIGINKNKNVTGISSNIPVAGVIKILKDIKDFSSLGIIYSEEEKDTVQQAAAIEKLGEKFSFKAKRINIVKHEDASKISGVDAIFITTSCAGQQCTVDIIGKARELKAPTASTISGGEEQGVLLTVSPNTKEQGRVLAGMLEKVIAGTPPNSIPIKSPRKVDMVINLKEANSMGLKIPFDILTGASRIIR